MNGETFSLIVLCCRDMQKDITQMRVINVNTAKELLLSEASFLLYFWIEGVTVERCLIRHLPSGREIYVQSGPGLQVFLRACFVSMQVESLE